MFSITFQTITVFLDKFYFLSWRAVFLCTILELFYFSSFEMQISTAEIDYLVNSTNDTNLSDFAYFSYSVCVLKQ